MDKVKRNPVIMIEAFKGLSPHTQVFFHRKNISRQVYRPSQKSLERFARHLGGAKIMLHKTGIYIQKWIH